MDATPQHTHSFQLAPHPLVRRTFPLYAKNEHLLTGFFPYRENTKNQNQRPTKRKVR